MYIKISQHDSCVLQSLVQCGHKVERELDRTRVGVLSGENDKRKSEKS